MGWVWVGLALLAVGVGMWSMGYGSSRRDEKEVSRWMRERLFGRSDEDR